MFKYELWMDGNMLTEESGFEDEAKAEEAGKQAAEDRIQMWKDDDAYCGETIDDFDIRVKED